MRKDVKFTRALLSTCDFPGSYQQARMVWTVACGIRTTSGVALVTGISQRSIQSFLQDLGHLELIEKRREGWEWYYTPLQWHRWVQGLVPAAALLLQKHTWAALGPEHAETVFGIKSHGFHRPYV